MAQPGRSMEIRFVGHTVGDSTQKRRQIQRNRACESCRRRKKRCEHVDIPEYDEAFNSSVKPANYRLNGRFEDQSSSLNQATEVPMSAQDQSSPSGGRTNSSFESHPRGSASALSPNNSRFIGDLSPEVIFHQSIPNATESHRPDQDNVGFWLGSIARPQEPSSDSNPDLSVENFFPTRFSALRTYLRDECLATIPPRPQQDELISIYFAKFNQIIPLVDKASFERARLTREVSVPLTQAICLVASKDVQASNYLYLPGSGLSKSPREFGQKLYAALLSTLYLNLEEDKITLIQVLALMSLHSEGADGWEASSLHLGEAIHHAHTIGLHLGRLEVEDQNEWLTKLFWCLWTLDRQNAAMHGRPVFIHEQDIGKNLQASFAIQKFTFGVWLRVANVLDKVIDLYRPKADISATGWEDGFPDFEDIVSECDAEKADPNLLVTIEVFYHAVAILSCRVRNLNSNAPRSSHSYMRQSFSAIRLTAIASSDYNSHLVALPVLPYAISLSMSVAYRQLRQSKMKMHQDRSKADLQTNCSLLVELSSRFWFAETMGKLGDRTLAGLQSTLDPAVAPTDSQSRRKRKGDDQQRTQAGRRQDKSFREQESNAAQDPDSSINSNKSGLVLSDALESTVGENVGSTDWIMDAPGTGDDFSYLDFDLLNNPYFADIDAAFGVQLDLSYPTTFADYVPTLGK